MKYIKNLSILSEFISNKKITHILKKHLKYKINFNYIYLIFFFCIFFICKTSAKDTKEFHWDLLRDIRDYQAGRLHYGIFPGTKIQLNGDDSPVVITYSKPENIEVPQYFYFNFPKILKTKNIKIELNFKWPNSKGILILAVAAWSKELLKEPPKIIGTLLKFGKDGGFFTGNIRYPLIGEKNPKAYDFAPLKKMGNKNHVLLINITQDRIESTLDSTHLSWEGKTSPNGFAIIGINMLPKNDGGECFIFNKFLMNIDLNTDTEE